MTAVAGALERLRQVDQRTAAPALGAAVAFGVLYWQPLSTLAREWWTAPDAGHGLLLAPLAILLAWRRGRAPGAERQPTAGLAILAGAVLLRYAAGLAAELFTMRLSALGAALGLVIFIGGHRQARHWWLPTALLALAIPLPAVVLGPVALALQLKASQLGAALLEMRHVPVHLSGNVIHLPGQSLFVAEACSGLRSLTALLALGVLIGGLWLRSIPARVFVILAAVPVAMLLNGVRIFLTGFFAHFVSPSLADGIMHYSEGWGMFVVALAVLGLVAWGTAAVEAHVLERRVI